MTNILITGATGGIGAATARKFAEVGSTVLLHTFQNVQSAERIAEEVRKAGAEAAVFTADFSHPGSAGNLYRQVYRRVEHIDVLVNAAGADLMSPSIHSMSFEEKMRLLWQIDVAVPIRLSRTIARQSSGKNAGKDTGGSTKRTLIVFFSSNSVDYGWRGETAELYGTAKGALQGFSRSFAQTVSPDVRVCCLSLGWITTRWGDSLPLDKEKRYAADSLLNRWGTPEEVAATVRFLADDASLLLDGCRLYVDGGKRSATAG
ncbi:MAG: SDR family oxidoreductase [Planctomycetaceae bacterium]|jgi:3-oxoacyl-[acyl-carrier protein] reductase|nr:SDR family oxidoreductase [Planctomycetaceae bacterium]